MLDAILMEEQGVPAIAIVTAPFRNTGRAMAESWGKPGYPFLDIPHPIANLTEAQLDERCDRLAERLARRHQMTVTVRNRKRSASHEVDADGIKALRAQADLVISGIGD